MKRLFKSPSRLFQNGWLVEVILFDLLLSACSMFEFRIRKGTDRHEPHPKCPTPAPRMWGDNLLVAKRKQWAAPPQTTMRRQPLWERGVHCILPAHPPWRNLAWSKRRQDGMHLQWQLFIPEDPGRSPAIGRYSRSISAVLTVLPCWLQDKGETRFWLHAWSTRSTKLFTTSSLPLSLQSIAAGSVATALNFIL